MWYLLNMMQQCIKMKPAEWSRYIAIYLGLPSECRYMACRLTSDIFTKECQHYSLHPVLPPRLWFILHSQAPPSPQLCQFNLLVNLLGKGGLLPNLATTILAVRRTSATEGVGKSKQPTFFGFSYYYACNFIKKRLQYFNVIKIISVSINCPNFV